jgi:hypothetical protein
MRHGARFAPDKYQLIHFTRRRRDPSGDLASAVRIGDHLINPETTLRVLGVWVDPKLNWKEHIRRAASKGLAGFETLSRIAASTWGPSMRRARLIYTAAIRPAMMYGCQVWGPASVEPVGRGLIKPLEDVQRKCATHYGGLQENAQGGVRT